MEHATIRMGHRYAACAFAFRCRKVSPHPAEQETSCRWSRPRIAKRPRRSSTCQNTGKKHRNNGDAKLTSREQAHATGALPRRRGGLGDDPNPGAKALKILSGEFHRTRIFQVRRVPWEDGGMNIPKYSLWTRSREYSVDLSSTRSMYGLC